MPIRWMLILAAAALAGTMATLTAQTPSEALSAPPSRTGRDATPAGEPTSRPRPQADQTGDDAGSRHTSPKPLTEEQEKVVLDYLKAKRPELHQQILGYRQSDPRRYRRATRSMWSFISRIKSLPENVREAHEARQSIYLKMYRLARDLAAAKDPAVRKDLERQLLELAQQQFDADQVIREYRLTELGDQIKRLKVEMTDREKDRAAIVREMVERMKKSAAQLADGGAKGPRTRPAAEAGTPRTKPPAR